jgi:DNA-binding XRE family transcriptional regulator
VSEGGEAGGRARRQLKTTKVRDSMTRSSRPQRADAPLPGRQESLVVAHTSVVRETVATNLRSARKRAGLSQSALAEQSGVDKGTISRIERAEADTVVTKLGVCVCAQRPGSGSAGRTARGIARPAERIEGPVRCVDDRDSNYQQRICLLTFVGARGTVSAGQHRGVGLREIAKYRIGDSTATARRGS